MLRRQSATKSSAESEENDWLDLDLPEITAENGPIDHPEPSSVLAHQHSVLLATSVPAEVWEKRREMMNPNRFEM